MGPYLWLVTLGPSLPPQRSCIRGIQFAAMIAFLGGAWTKIFFPLKCFGFGKNNKFSVHNKLYINITIDINIHICNEWIETWYWCDAMWYVHLFPFFAVHHFFLQWIDSSRRWKPWCRMLLKHKNVLTRPEKSAKLCHILIHLDPSWSILSEKKWYFCWLSMVKEYRFKNAFVRMLLIIPVNPSGILQVVRDDETTWKFCFATTFVDFWNQRLSEQSKS